MSEYLRSKGIPAISYHAGLSNEVRKQNQEAFIRGNADIVVATIAFGMGINKPDVRFIFHCDMPRTVENYYQEIGRAGRDGLPSRCILFYSWADVMNYENFMQGHSDPELARLAQKKTVEFFRMAESRMCRHRAVISYFEEHIENCGKSCDICSGKELKDLISTKIPASVRAAAATVLSSYVPISGARAEEPDEELLEKLKKTRKRIADEQDVPAYIVFNDAVLLQMALKKPRSGGEMLEVSGVGEVKLKKYGKIFMETIAEHTHVEIKKTSSGDPRFSALMEAVKKNEGTDIKTKTGLTFRYKVYSSNIVINASSWDVKISDLEKAHAMWPVDRLSEFKNAGIKSSGTYMWAILNKFAGGTSGSIDNYVPDNYNISGK
jgi:superfamily II DNA helicase RecQ